MRGCCHEPVVGVEGVVCDAGVDGARWGVETTRETAFIGVDKSDMVGISCGNCRNCRICG